MGWKLERWPGWSTFPAETEHIVVSFRWFGTYFALRKLLADFIITRCNCSTFSFRKGGYHSSCGCVVFQDFLSSLCVLGTNLPGVIGQLIQSVWPQRFLSQHCMSSDDLLWRWSADFYHGSHPGLESELWAMAFFTSLANSVHRPFDCYSACLL